MSETITKKMMTELKRMHIIKGIHYGVCTDVDAVGIYNKYLVTSDDMKLYDAQAFFENGEAAGTLDFWHWAQVIAKSKWKPSFKYFRIYPFNADGIEEIIPCDFTDEQRQRTMEFVIDAQDDIIDEIFSEQKCCMDIDGKEVEAA